MFHGPAEGENAETKELTPWEGLMILPFVVGIVFLGVYPKPMLERMEPAIDALVVHVEEQLDGEFTEPVPTVGREGTFAELLHETHESEEGKSDDDHGEGE